MKVKGYRVAADLEGTTLTATADGRVGKAALGTDERAIDLTQVEAVSFERAGMMKNGSLVLVDARGKTHLHFRKKDNDAWKALYEAITGLVLGALEVHEGRRPRPRGHRPVARREDGRPRAQESRTRTVGGRQGGVSVDGRIRLVQRDRAAVDRAETVLEHPGARLVALRFAVVAGVVAGPHVDPRGRIGSSRRRGRQGSRGVRPTGPRRALETVIRVAGRATPDASDVHSWVGRGASDFPGCSSAVSAASRSTSPPRFGQRVICGEAGPVLNDQHRRLMGVVVTATTRNVLGQVGWGVARPWSARKLALK